ncbi:MAG: mannose-1-phosphate guanylyltransferase [Planctomycetota bacterium]
MLHSVILAGGSGTRFWPRSRRALPKQLLALAGERTLLQDTHDRVAPLGRSTVIVTGAELAPEISAQLPGVELLVEPCARDTAAAIGLAACVLAARDPAATLAITPADQVVRPAAAFQEAVREAAALAAEPGTIVTFGIRPTSPHTGYGYIERGAPLVHGGRLPAFQVAAFREKPPRAVAEAYLADGRHAWNSGVFVATAATLLDELERHLPGHHAALTRVAAAWDAPERDQVLAEAFAALPRVSIDYGVMERAARVCVLEADYAWSDVGSWAAVQALHEPDPEGNVVLDAPCLALDSRGCLVWGDGRLVALLGVEGLAVVQTGDATLVCPLERAEEVKALVARLEAEGRTHLL